MDIKKLFPEKKVSRKGLLEFLDKKGFYIVLVLCIVIVGATAVFVTTNNLSSLNGEYDTQKIIPEETAGTSKETVQSAVTSQPADAQKKAAVKPAETGKTDSNKQAAPKVENKSAAPSGKPAGTGTTGAAEKNQKFILPVFGEVSFEYSQDKPVYSKTLEDWRTHSGIDYAAERGTPVKAVSDGVVTDVKNDPRLGVVVIVDHKNGLKTVYGNLASGDMVSPNQKVKQGDVIGSVGNTASFESAEQPHVHFEVLKNNEPVNPLAYMPKK